MNTIFELACIRTGIIFSILILASCCDLKNSRVDNRIIFCGWFLSFLFHFIGKPFILQESIHPIMLLDYMGGLLLPICIFWIFNQMGTIGAGDVKLLSVIGAFHGVEFIIHMLLPVLIAGGTLSFVHVIYHNNLWERLRYFTVIMKRCIEEKRIVSYKEDLSARDKAVIPFTLAISIGYFITWIGGLM